MALWLLMEQLKVRSLICVTGLQIVKVEVMNIRINAIAGASLLIEYSRTNRVFQL